MSKSATSPTPSKPSSKPPQTETVEARSSTATAKPTTRKAAAKPATRGGTSNSRPPASSSKPATTSKPATSTSRSRKPATPRQGLFSRWSLPKLNWHRPRFRWDARRQSLLGGLGLLVLVVLLGLSWLSPNQGWLMGGILNLLGWLFGWFQPLMLVVLGGVGVLLVAWGMNSPRPWFTAVRSIGLILLLTVLLAQASMLALYMDNGLDSYEAIVRVQAGGGLIGSLIAQTLSNLLGTAGAVLVLTVVGLFSAVMAVGVRWEDFQQVYHAWQAKRAAKSAPAIPQPVPQPEPLPLFAPRPSAPDAPHPVPLNDTAETVATWVEPTRPASHQRPADPALPSPSPSEAEAEPATTSAPATTTSRRKKSTPAPAPSAPPLILGREATQNVIWQLPDITELLNLGEEYVNNNEHMREQTQIIEETLISFGAPGIVVDVLPGPTLVQYCVEPQYIAMRNGRRTKVKVGKIASLADDLALALAARSVRIQAPVPGKGYVGIEVPNEAKALVSLRDVMESAAFAKLARKSPLAIGLGQDVAGVPIAADLAKMPHMLIAGATGSGKSVCVNAIIACLLLQNTPEELQLVMVDPKRVELTGYNGIPHLAAPVVVDMERVLGTLQWALREMDNRYRQFAEVGARNLEDFNKHIQRNGGRSCRLL
jgi:DNA segregation ATPase FtsK/SpoIIIE, S-DNA-T family